nr:hypothetical protein [uncultured Desulfobacter sp.]
MSSNHESGLKKLSSGQFSLYEYNKHPLCARQDALGLSGDGKTNKNARRFLNIFISENGGQCGLLFYMIRFRLIDSPYW